MAAVAQFSFSPTGRCPICETPATFIADHPYLRDSLKCTGCGSIPRQRALFFVLNEAFPHWRHLAIHEAAASPWSALCQKFRAECPRYVESQFIPDAERGSVLPRREGAPAAGWRNEDLERQTFPDMAFDVVITQDVFEHIFHPDLAMAEIARTLRPGGAHIATVPLTQLNRGTRRRASLVNGTAVHHLPPEFHGNPMSSEGSLVTIDWGHDIGQYLAAKSGLGVAIVRLDMIDLGMRADLIDVLICRKDTTPNI